jgi:hypothetical protein
LIAASASLRKAKPVHRDPHFFTIPTSLLKQVVLPEKVAQFCSAARAFVAAWLAGSSSSWRVHGLVRGNEAFRRGVLG